MPLVRIGPLSIEAPQTWTLSTVILAGPFDPPAPDPALLWTKPPRPFQRNLIATLEMIGPAETPESYVGRQIKGLREAGVAREEARPSETVTLEGGRAGLLTEQVILSANGERVRQMQLVTLKDGCAYTLIASHLDGAPFEAARAEFRNMLLSFR
jgi:hypothetical protein